MLPLFSVNVDDVTKTLTTLGTGIPTRQLLNHLEAIYSPPVPIIVDPLVPGDDHVDVSAVPPPPDPADDAIPPIPINDVQEGQSDAESDVVETGEKKKAKQQNRKKNADSTKGGEDDDEEKEKEESEVESEEDDEENKTTIKKDPYKELMHRLKSKKNNDSSEKLQELFKPPLFYNTLVSDIASSFLFF